MRMAANALAMAAREAETGEADLVKELRLLSELYGANVLLDACLEIATGHSRAVVHMMVDATYDRLEDKPRKPSPRAH